MSVKNNKGVAAQALLEMDSIVSAIKEESKKTLGGMLNEAVKNALRESVEDDDEKDYEVIDDEKDGAEDKKEKGSKKKTSSSDVSEDENGELEGGMPQGGQQMPQNKPQAGAGMQQAGGMDDGMEDPALGGGQEAPMGGDEGGLDAAGAGAEGEGDEGWDEFSDYKVGDDTYDLTGENDYENVVKIYKLLSDEDEVVVKKDGDKIQLKDNQAGTEYVIDLGGEGEEPKAASTEEPMSGEEEPSGLNEEEGFDIAGFPGDVEDDNENFDGLSDGVGEFDDEEFHDDIDDLGDDEFDDEDDFGDDDIDFEDDGLGDDSFASDELGMNNDLYENKRMKKPMKESKQVLFEVDLGYTDNYQDKDPIKGLSNNEPSKSGKSWHKGVPTGTQKPWAGPSKPKGDPFGEKTIEEGEDCCPKCGKCGAECTCGKEVEEQKNVGGFVQQNSVTASNIPNSNGRKARSQRSASQGVEVTGSADPRYKSAANESKELKAIKAENRELKKAVLELRKNLNEAYITNVNLGKITKLFLENTTSKAEKVDIVNRFANEAKTVEQSKALFESISRELKKGNSNPMNLNESSQTAKGTKELNENTYKSAEVLKTIDFMNRVLNC
jgi:hypothetical protein